MTRPFYPLTPTLSQKARERLPFLVGEGSRGEVKNGKVVSYVFLSNWTEADYKSL
jgi:hypothetical protein